MKKLVFGLLAVTLLGSCQKGLFNKSKSNESEMVVDLSNDTTKLSYALGVSIVGNLKNQGIDTLDADAFTSAMKGAYAGDSIQMTEEEANAFLQEYFQLKADESSRAAKEEGAAYLVENGKKSGVVTTASGLQYQVIEEGTGASPSATDVVKVHYTGTLIDGTVFDSSVQRGTPAEFPLNQVIAGWTEGLQLMKEGAKYKFFIPYNLAYGDRGAGGQIPGYAALVFDVELLEIVKK